MIPTSSPQKKLPPVLIIMGKAPLPGRCNTRLAPKLSFRGAARLQRQLLFSRLQQANAAGLATELHASPNLKHPAITMARRYGHRTKLQSTGDLGRRMRCAQARRPTIFIGTDCPSLDSHYLKQAAVCVDAGRAVCVPAFDGGYVMLALPGHYPRVFRNIPWGSRNVFSHTRKQLQSCPFETEFWAPLNDLDTPADYRLMRRQALIASPGQKNHVNFELRRENSDRRSFTNSQF